MKAHCLRLGIRASLVIAVAAALGCSKFKSSQRVNLAPFAEDMIAIAGDIQYGLGQVHVVYVRDYADIS